MAVAVKRECSGRSERDVYDADLRESCAARATIELLPLTECFECSGVLGGESGWGSQNGSGEVVLWEGRSEKGIALTS
jgi:hypothetical protein